MICFCLSGSDAVLKKQDMNVKLSLYVSLFKIFFNIMMAKVK